MKHKAFRLLRGLGLLRAALRVRVGNGVLLAPADEWDFWRLRDADDYDPDIAALCAVVNRRLGDFDLLDLGADIGMVSRIVHAACPGLCSVTAVEPNPHAFPFLQQNLADLPITATALEAAVSDVAGRARFVFDPTRRSDHAGHIGVGEDGGTTVAVETVDRIFTPRARDLLLKVDVEGQERAVLEGARETVRRAERVVLFLEVHPGVLRRTGARAEDLFAAAEAIRPCAWMLADSGMPPVDRGRAFFEQFPAPRQHDVIGVMEPGGGGTG